MFPAEGGRAMRCWLDFRHAWRVLDERGRVVVPAPVFDETRVRTWRLEVHATGAGGEVGAVHLLEGMTEAQAHEEARAVAPASYVLAPMAAESAAGIPAEHPRHEVA